MGSHALQQASRRLLIGAASDAANLVVAGTAFVAAMVFGSWWLLALGILLYSSFITWKAVSPSAWQKALAPPEGVRCLPDPSCFCDPFLRSSVIAINAGQREVARTLAETPADVRRHFAVTLCSLDEIERCAALMMVRIDDMSRYLQVTRSEPIQNEVRRIGDLLLLTTDDETQKEYRKTLHLREQQLSALQEIGCEHERATASLLRVVATIEGLPTRIMRMRVLDAQLQERLSCEVNNELDRINADLLASEEALCALRLEAQDSHETTDLPLIADSTLSCQNGSAHDRCDADLTKHRRYSCYEV